MNQPGTVERTHLVRCLLDGRSMRAVSRIPDVARNTIDKLLVELGAACSEYQDRTLRNLTSKRIQVDECWSFGGYNQKQVTLEKVERVGVYGDVWTWAAIDADTKLIPCWSLGQRDAATATRFVADLADRLADRMQLTSYGLKAYLGAVEKAFHGAVDYATLVRIYGEIDVEGQRRYSPAQCIGREFKAVTDDPDPDQLSTSHIERANLTTRMGTRRFTRLTNGYSKKLENHAAAVSLHMMFYNFGRKHVKLGTSPAVAAGIADHIWSVEEIISC